MKQPYQGSEETQRELDMKQLDGEEQEFIQQFSIPITCPRLNSFIHDNF